MDNNQKNNKTDKCGCSKSWSCAGHTSMEDMGKRVGGKQVYSDPAPVPAVK